MRHSVLDFGLEQVKEAGTGQYPVWGSDGEQQFALVERAEGDVERLHCVGSQDQCLRELDKLVD